MKVKIILILTLILVFSLQANDQIRKVKQNIDQLNLSQLTDISGTARIIEKTNAVWNDSMWIFSTRSRFTYLPNNAVDQEFEDAFGFSGWEDYNRWNYEYGQAELLINIFEEQYNFAQWDTTKWRLHTYYPDNKLKDLTRYVMFPAGWYPSQKEIYEYNQDGLVNKQFIQNSISETDWLYTYLFETTYTPAGQIDEIIGYVSDNGDSVWTVSYKLSHSYNAAGIEEQVIFSVWNGVNDWIPSSRTVNTIVDGKITEITSQADYGSGWEDTERDLMVYDENGNLASVQSQQYWQSQWQNTRLKTYEYDPASSISMVGEAVIADEYQLLDNYPNPFNPETTIKFNIPKAGYVNLQVYNLLGQTVATLVDKEMAAGQYTTSFKADHLPSGVYFYRIQASDFLMTKRMVLLK
jgi:hypothetical protein